jgi:diacylglycerol kinase
MDGGQRTQEDGKRRPRRRSAFNPARLLTSFAFALEGLGYVARTQPNWRIHLAAAACAATAAIGLQVSPIEMAVLALAVGLVLAFEAVNTAIECAIDAQGGGPTILAKHAKDASAGAVLIAAATSVVVAAVIFGPRILARL